MSWENLYKNKQQLNRYPYTEIVSFYFQNRTDLSDNFNALDIGCGSGIHSAFLAEQGGQVLGIDFSPSAIEHAQETYGSDHVRFEVADFVDYTPKTGPYHLAIDRLSTTHSSVPITVGFYQRLKTELASGARLFWQGFSDDNAAIELAQTKGDGYYEDFTGSVFKSLGRAAFFSEKQVHDVFAGYTLLQLRKISDLNMINYTNHTSWIAELRYD